MSKCAYVIYVYIIIIIIHFRISTSSTNLSSRHAPTTLTSAASPLFGASQPPWGDSKSSKPNMRFAGCASQMLSDQFLTGLFASFAGCFPSFHWQEHPPTRSLRNIGHLEIPNWRSSTASWNSFLSTGRLWPPPSVKRCKKSPSSWAYTIRKPITNHT